MAGRSSIFGCKCIARRWFTESVPAVNLSKISTNWQVFSTKKSFVTMQCDKMGTSEDFHPEISSAMWQSSIFVRNWKLQTREWKQFPALWQLIPRNLRCMHKKRGVFFRRKNLLFLQLRYTQLLSSHPYLHNKRIRIVQCPYFKRKISFQVPQLRIFQIFQEDLEICGTNIFMLIPW